MSGIVMAGIKVEHIIPILGGHPTLCYKECSITNLFLSIWKGEEKEVERLREDFQIQITKFGVQVETERPLYWVLSKIYFYFSPALLRNDKFKVVYI